MGISSRPGQVPPAVQELADRARGGDKQAQLELGIRFEEGRELVRDLNKAKALYRQAASDSGGVVWIYSPPIQQRGSGRVIPINKGARQIGLEEARRRLEMLGE